MNTRIILNIRSTISLVIVTTFLFATPAWSAPGKKKPDLNNSTERSVLDPDNKKIEEKSKNKAKKKIVKKVGTAAAVGVATKKVRSGLKDTVKSVGE